MKTVGSTHYTIEQLLLDWAYEVRNTTAGARLCTVECTLQDPIRAARSRRVQRTQYIMHNLTASARCHTTTAAAVLPDITVIFDSLFRRNPVQYRQTGHDRILIMIIFPYHYSISELEI